MTKVKSLGDESSGTPFTIYETLYVIVTDEINTPNSGYAGATITYTATVLDNHGNPLPLAFVASLELTIFEQTPPFSSMVVPPTPFSSAVYNFLTGELTFHWVVPTGIHWQYSIQCGVTQLEWNDQYF